MWSRQKSTEMVLVVALAALLAPLALTGASDVVLLFASAVGLGAIEYLGHRGVVDLPDRKFYLTGEDDGDDEDGDGADGAAADGRSSVGSWRK